MVRAEEFVSHTDALFRYAMALSRSVPAAEDLVQETFVRAFSAKNPLRPDSNYKSWLFTILKNIWLNHVRKERWNVQILDAEPDGSGLAIPASLDSDPHRRYVSKLEVAQIRGAIQQLPMEFREIIILREYDELSYQEIAGMLGCPVGTVMSRLARARSRLRTILSGQELENDSSGSSLEQVQNPR